MKVEDPDGWRWYPRRVKNPSDLETLRSQYRARVEAVERALAEELAALSDEAALERTLSLRLFVTESIPENDSSGLIEQQALFQRAVRA